jgi:hypothetical protein
MPDVPPNRAEPFPAIVILSSSEQEKHSSGLGKLFFFLPQFSFLLF